MITKSLVRFGLFSAVLALAACGDDDGGGGGGADAGGGADGGGGPALSGTVMKFAIVGSPTPESGATVSVHGGSATTTSGADGTFTLATGEGQMFVNFAKTGFWASLIAYDINASGLSGITALILDDATVGTAEQLAGATLDETKGILFFNFPTPKAGVSITLSTPGEGSFTVAGTSIEQGTTTSADTTALLHYNVPVGESVGLTLSDASCRFEPVVTTAPVVARTITTIDVICTAQ